MLQTLRIRNLALLEELSLDFEGGFNVVTGETGAGKSILLGALSLLAGARAEKSLIRQGANACEVEASLSFASSEGLDRVLAELELPPCEEGLLVLRRSLPRDKAPKITVNGSLSTLAALQKLGEYWIDFHGPSEPRRLLKESCQLELLDLFARNQVQLGTYAADYRLWRETQGEKERLLREERLGPEQISFLAEQLAALDRLELSPEALEELEREYGRMSQAQELRGLAESLELGLAGEDGVLRKLGQVLKNARQFENLDPESKVLADRLGSTVVDLQDLAEEYRALAQELNFDEERVAQLEERMQAWLEAKRRHGGTPDSVREAREVLRRKLAIQGDIEGALADLDQRLQSLFRALREQARTLREQREKAARELAKVVSRSLSELGFKKAEFQIALHSLTEFGPTGACRCEFLFSPNVGEAPQALARIASSGELARVMLALKTVLADLDSVPVLVFDEVDANVGGEIGRIVGEKLAGIARTHQVFCVTHLPQVAAQGTAHYLVEKDQSRERAEVRIQALHQEREARVSELARMLGDRKARSALSHAEELLAAAATAQAKQGLC